MEFDETVRQEDDWRLRANCLAWGSQEPEIVILGFSKGATQAGALGHEPHNEIAYKSHRSKVGKILKHVGLLEDCSAEAVSREIANTGGRFHFGSLIRCTVERFDHKTQEWTGTGGGMLDKFVATPFGRQVSGNCTKRFLTELPDCVKLVVLFGMGTNLNYVREAFSLISAARGGDWHWINKVSYTDGRIVVVHVEHFASLGSLIPNWLGETGHSRCRLGRMAREAVVQSGVALVGGRVSPAAPEVTDSDPEPVSRPRKWEHEENGFRTGGGVLLDGIADIFHTCGYSRYHATKKVTGFQAASGRAVYVVNDQLRPDNIVLSVDPLVDTGLLRKMGGAPEVSNGPFKNSNFRAFPKAVFAGSNPISYGWRVAVRNSEALAQFLKDYSQL